MTCSSSLFFFTTSSYPTTPFLFQTPLASTVPPCVHLVLHYHDCSFLSTTSSQHCLYPSISSLCFPKGPFFRFQTYSDWLRQPSPLALPSWVPCLQRLKLVPVFGALFVAVNSVFPLAYVRTEEFLDNNFFFRYCAMVDLKSDITCFITIVVKRDNHHHYIKPLLMHLSYIR